MKVTTHYELPRFPTDTPVRELLFRQIGKVTCGMLVKRENKGSGGIADLIVGVNIDSYCWYQGMKFFSLFPQKAVLQPDVVCWVTACSWGGRVGHWYPGIGWTYPQLQPLMQIQQELVSLSWEAVWFASIYASFRERLIVIQGNMIRKRKNIIYDAFYLSEGELMGFHLNKSLRSSTGSQE